MFFIGGQSEVKDYYDIIVIGGGPAGLGAALYATRAGLSCLVIESNITGGQMNETDVIENYPGFEEIKGAILAEKMKRHAEKFGAEFHTATVVDADFSGQVKRIRLDDGSTISSEVVIIATGAAHKKLNVPGEREFTGKGVSYCATCDGHFFKGKTVAMVGGGDTAITEALYLSNIVSKVVVIHRRDRLRATKVLQERAFKKENIEFLWNTIVKEIRGSDKVEELLLENKKTGETFTIKVDGIFIAIGISPNTELFRGKINLDSQGYIVTNENMETNIKGVYAAGDVRAKNLRQVITAVADGAIAASHAAGNYFD
ncbi:MAG: thioredoxin-disulfide reductase [Thermotogaceae bacterium]|nr:thioredoxin-disulfide reductase [Thermotogaceae bacterium]